MQEKHDALAKSQASVEGIEEAHAKEVADLNARLEQMSAEAAAAAESQEQAWKQEDEPVQNAEEIDALRASLSAASAQVCKSLRRPVAIHALSTLFIG